MPNHAPERPLSPVWLRILGLVSFALALSVFAWWPMLKSYPGTQGFDGPFIQEMLESARVSVARYHELPLWNPYQCGGVPLWDNPQGMGAAPLFWPLLAFADTTRAIELWYLLHSAAGFLCMWVFARHELRLSRGAAMVSSIMWAFCGAHNQHCTGGGFNWAPFFFLPLSVFFWRRAERDVRMAVGLSVLTAFEIWGGAAYPVAFVTLILAGETATRAWQPARWAAIARAGAVVVVVTFCLSAARFLPVIYQLRSHKRPIGEELDTLQWSTLADMFLSRTHSRGVAGQTYVWPEYADYVGPFLLALAVIGIVLGSARNGWLLAVLAWAFLLMLGHAGAWAPWEILKGHVYPFKEMRVPSRFNIAVTMFLAAFAGIAVDRGAALVRRLSGSRPLATAAGTALLVLGLVGAGDMIGNGADWTAQCFNGAPLTPRLLPSPRLYLEGPGLASFLDQPQQGRGRVDCWEEWAFEVGAPLWGGDVPQAKAADTTVATVEKTTRTQNTFAFDVTATRPTRVLLNGAYDLGWRTTHGTTVNNDHLLAVDVPAGYHHVVVKYWPRGLSAGFVITGLAVVGVIAFLVLDARRRKRALD